MRAITHGLVTALLLVTTAFCALVQIAHVDRAFQQIGGRDRPGQVSLVSHTDSGNGSGTHGHRHR